MVHFLNTFSIKINNELFLLDSQKSIVQNIKKFCDVKTIINQSNKTIFDINTNNETCIAIFPTSFSHNNNFLFINKNKKKQIKCDSFRAQYFFHGCIIKKSTKIKIRFRTKRGRRRRRNKY